MITKIAIENFKGIKDRVVIDLKPITLLFGPNSAGKSTILQAFNIVHDILINGNVDIEKTTLGGDSIDLGGFQNYVYKHDLSRKVTIALEMEPYCEDQPELLTFDDSEDCGSFIIKPDDEKLGLEFIIGWQRDIQRALVEKIMFLRNDSLIGTVDLVTHDKAGYKLKRNVYCITGIDFSHSNMCDLEDSDDGSSLEDALDIFNIGNDNDYEIGSNLFFEVDGKKVAVFKPIQILPAEYDFQQYGDLELFGFNWNSIIKNLMILKFNKEDIFDPQYLRNSIDATLKELFTSPLVLLRDYLSMMRYIGPLRSVPNRNFEHNKNLDKDRWHNGLGAWDLLFECDDSFIEKLNKTLDKLKIGYQIERKSFYKLPLDAKLTIALLKNTLLDEDLNTRHELEKLRIEEQIVLLDNHNNTKVSPSDIGVGVSQVLPVVVDAMDNDNLFSIIEQPELHIHPEVQVELADLFIEQLKNHFSDYGNFRFLLETHSEHLILRFLRRIEETNNKVSNNYFSFSNENIAVYWFEPSIDGMKIKHLPIDESGEFIGSWPKGFFEEREKELFPL